MHFYITTPRLVLRNFKSSDWKDTHEHRSDPEVCRYISAPISEEEAKHHVNKCLGEWPAEEMQWFGLAVELPSENKVIGEVAFRFRDKPNGQLEFGYRLNRNYQKQGFATEMVRGLLHQLFKVLELHKVLAFCDERNKPSYHLLEKLGFTREGLFREDYFINGVWSNTCIYGLLKSEW